MTNWTNYDDFLRDESFKKCLLSSPLLSTLLFYARVVYVGRVACASFSVAKKAHAVCGIASAGMSADVAGPTRAF